jgi:hypothetical protein
MVSHTVVDGQRRCGAAETGSDVDGDLVGGSWHNDHHSIFNLFSDSASTYLSLRTINVGGTNMGGCRVSVAIQPRDQADAREQECQRRGIFDVGDHMQTAASYADHYAWKSAPGSMANQCAHEWRAAQ